jgi:lipopolysaccharide export system permease protein
MGILQRYVILETLKLFSVTAVITLLLMTLGGGVREGLRNGLPPHLMLRGMPYLIPEMLQFTFPGCALFAVCSLFGRMTAANEMLAVKSLGINPLKVIWPVLILSYFLSIVTFEVHDLCAVWARPGLRRLLTESLDEIAYGVLRTSGAFTRQGLSIIVRGVRDDVLLQPLITYDPGNGKPLVTLTAQEAKLVVNADTGTLRLECRNGELEVSGTGRLSFPDEFVHELLLDPPLPDPDNHLRPSELRCGVIPQQIRREQRLLGQLERDLETALRQGAAPDANLSSQAEERRSRLFRLQAEISRRLASGFACSCFVLLGLPVAIWSRSSDVTSVFFLCFLPILLLFYPLFVVGENLARAGVWPYCSVWLADAVLSIIGVGLLWRVLRR